MKRRHIVLFLLILLAALALTPGAQAATVKPTSLTVSAPGYTGDPQTLAQMQVDMIFDMATGTRFNLSATPYLCPFAYISECSYVSIVRYADAFGYETGLFHSAMMRPDGSFHRIKQQSHS